MVTMLYIARKPGESVVINNNVTVTLLEVKGKTVKLGFDFPKETRVLRQEVFERIQKENQRAAESARLIEEL